MNGADRPASVVVLGGGVGGYTAAIRAARAGLAVTLINAGELGGTCLNVGCIPTKSLLHQAHAFRQAGAWSQFGIERNSLRLDYAAVGAEKQRVVDQLVQGVRTLVKRNRITLIAGHGELIDAHTVRVRETGARITADRIVIATGSAPLLPRLPGIDLPGVMSSNGALALDRLPASVLVIGGGVIGVEFAQIFSDFGSAVTIVEQQERLLPQEDVEIVAVLQQHLARSGVTMHFKSTVSAIRRHDAQLEATVTPDGINAGAVLTVRADAVLVAVGRRPATQDLGLERLGIVLERGAIVTDEFCRSAVPHIYAVGDARGGLLLAHKAAAEGEAAVDHMLGHGQPISAMVVPQAVYTSPEVASAGLSEVEARQRYGRVKVGRFPFSANGKALAMGAGLGFVKVIADAATDQIVGIAMVGPDVANLLGEATLAVQMELTLPALMQTVHAHPTLSEALMEAAHDAFDGGAIHLPPRAAPSLTARSDEITP